MIQMEELAQILNNDHLNHYNRHYNDPEKQAGKKIGKNPYLVTDPSATEKVKNLHKHEGIKDKGQMATRNMILIVVSFV